MNARKVLLRFRIGAGRSAPATQPRNSVVDSHFETDRACNAGKFMALKPAKGAQGE
jgi:hypothetical protein